MKIGIPLSSNAYTPESYAYANFLEKLGHIVQLDYELDPNNDINLHYMGINPFWQKKHGKAGCIHEYHSLSTPPFAKLKNILKKEINKKPNGRIFLSQTVSQEMNFHDNIPFIYRDMGIDSSFFQPPSQFPTYDILYCGSINGRIGLINVINELAKNYKIIIVGNVLEDQKKLFNKNVTILGRVNHRDLPSIYREARIGLNYTPDIYPFNIQTSTKTLEYLASGLTVLSNKYEWICKFSKQNKIKVLWLENHYSFDSDLVISNIDVDLGKFTWENILLNSKFENFLRETLDNV